MMWIRELMFYGFVAAVTLTGLGMFSTLFF
jgi:hypothetical protein